jgi:hypothetical protein
MLEDTDVETHYVREAHPSGTRPSQTRVNIKVRREVSDRSRAAWLRATYIYTTMQCLHNSAEYSKAQLPKSNNRHAALECFLLH